MGPKRNFRISRNRIRRLISTQMICEFRFRTPIRYRLPSVHEDQQDGDEQTVNGGRLCQGATQNQVSGDFSGLLRLPGDGLRRLAGGDADADARADAGENCDAAAMIPISMVVSSLKLGLFFMAERLELTVWKS